MSSTANGLTLLEAVITLPRVGVWHADLVVDTDDGAKVTGPVALSLVDGAIAFAGTSWRDALPWRGVAHARIAGGKAGMRTYLRPGDYQTSTVRTILMDILSAAGETLSPTVLDAVLDTEVDDWSRLGSSAGAALQSLVDDLDLTWRVLADGTVWVGAETWPGAAPFEYALMERHVEGGTMVLGVEVPLLLPGTLFELEKVGRVVHRLGPDRVRTDVYFDE